MRRQRGFTLVELVMVIVLLGIVATISTQFVALSTQGAIDVGDRQQRALQGVVISEQITREVREAFPLSVRSSDAGDECLEWLPIVGATAYTLLPTGAGSNTVEIQSFGQTIPEGARLIVYGYGSSQGSLYESGASVPNPGPVSPKIEKIENLPSGLQKVILAADHRFRERSPQKRIYAVGKPISVCQEQGSNSGRLYRFTDYGADTSATRSYNWLRNNADDKGLVSANLAKDSWNVQVTPISLKRSAVVNFAFVLESPNSDKEITRVSQEVQVRNVP